MKETARNICGAALQEAARAQSCYRPCRQIHELRRRTHHVFTSAMVIRKKNAFRKDVPFLFENVTKEDEDMLGVCRMSTSNTVLVLVIVFLVLCRLGLCYTHL